MFEPSSLLIPPSTATATATASPEWRRRTGSWRRTTRRPSSPGSSTSLARSRACSSSKLPLIPSLPLPFRPAISPIGFPSLTHHPPRRLPPPRRAGRSRWRPSRPRSKGRLRTRGTSGARFALLSFGCSLLVSVDPF